MVNIDNQMIENANKLAFLVDIYPKHKLSQIMKLFHLPPVDINTMIWAAEDLKLVEIDYENDAIIVGVKPETWTLGKDVKHIQDALVFTFKKIESKQSDLEETYVGNQTLGYAAHDVMVAVKDLIEQGVLADYDIQDTDKDGSVNTYTFYTLAENKSKQWGLLQFKNPPVPGIVEETKEAEVPEAELPDAPVDNFTPVGEQGAVKTTDNPETQNEVEPVATAAPEQPVSETAEEPQNAQPEN